MIRTMCLMLVGVTEIITNYQIKTFYLQKNQSYMYQSNFPYARQLEFVATVSNYTSNTIKK